MQKKSKHSWLFSRSLILFLISLFGLMMVAFFINMIGISITGTVENWQHYLTKNAHYFFVWRLTVYGLVIVGWLWAKKRLIAREYAQDKPSMNSFKQRILRIELSTAIAFIALEVSNGLGR